MLLTPSQKIIARDTHRFRVANCGRRFGKTILASEEIKGKAIASECRIAYIAPTYGQARDIIWQTLIKELKPVANKINESRLEIEVNNLVGTTSLIQLRGWESIETLRGQKFHFVVIDEVAMMRNFWIYWQEVIIPTLTDTKGEVLFISTPKGFNHFYELYNLENESDDWKSFHFTTYDNTHIDDEEINKLKSQMTEDRFAQEYLAEFKRTEGLVYKEFDRDRHIYKELPDFHWVEKIAGVDFGFTNPTAIYKILKDRDNRYWIDTEWYKTGQTNDQIAETILSLEVNKVYPDPEAPDKIQELKNKGINCLEVNKGKDSIKNGISKVRELLKQNRLFISAQCKNLIWELETYSYPDKRPDNPEPEVPIKYNDHGLDAIRYALVSNCVEPVINDNYLMEQIYNNHQIINKKFE
jgi:PBSX family phage terminase large subunit